MRPGVVPGICACFVALLAGCSDDPSSPPSPPSPPSPAPPATSTLRVTVSTSGDDTDPDGYLVRVDGTGQPVRVSPNGSVTFSGLRVGDHTIELTEVASNCVVDGGSAVATISSPGTVTDMELHVTCSALGSVRVTIATAGTDLDGDGYTVVVNGTNVSYSDFRTIGTSDATTVLRLDTGHYVFSLRRVAANCGPDLDSRELDVVSGTVQTVDFAVVCEPIRRIAYVASFGNASSEIYTIRSDGTGTVQLTNDLVWKTDPAWSPDGTRIAYTGERDGRRAIYVMSEDGSDVRRLTPLTWDSFYPAWSPDGTRIAFVSIRDANPDVYVMNADGSGEFRLTNNSTIDTDPAWSPDGARIAFSSDRAGNHDIYVMSADGSGITRVTNGPTLDRYPAFTPDGSRLAFSGSAIVFVVGPTGPPVGVGFGDDPAWSPDGRKIAVTTFTCDWSGYYVPTCSMTGIGILAPFTDGTSGSRETWDPRLTAGRHAQPAWRP